MVASRIVFTRSYIILYVLLILVQTFLLGYGLYHHGFSLDSEREDPWSAPVFVLHP